MQSATRMGTVGNLELALRTIVVTTRTAIATHRMAGNDALLRASARHGLGLLDDLESRMPPDATARDQRNIEDARRELLALAEDR